MQLNSGAKTGAQILAKREWHGGGWVTRPAIDSTGRVFIRTDTSPPFRRDVGATKWKSLRKYGPGQTLPYSKFYTDDATYEFAISPDGQFYWEIGQQQLWFSSDAGETLVDVPLAVFPRNNGQVPPAGEGAVLAHDGPDRMVGGSMAVDPANGRRLLVIIPGGLYEVIANLDGTFTRTQIAGVPGNMPFRRRGMVAFDSTPGTVGAGVATKTKRAYCWTEGTGPNDGNAPPVPKGQLWVTQDAATWAQDATCPALHATTMKCNPLNGHLWLGGGLIQANADHLIAEEDGPMFRFTAGAGWSASLVAAKNVTFHRTDATKVLVGHPGGSIQLSTNSGTAFGALRQPARGGSDSPWIDWTNEGYMSAGGLAAAPNDDVWFTYGLGAAVSSDCWRVTGDPIVWATMAAGMDQLISQLITVVRKPGHRLDGRSITTVQDRTFVVQTRAEITANKPLRRHGPDNALPIRHGGQSDYAAQDPEFMAVSARAGGSGVNGDLVSVYISRAGGDEGSWQRSGRPLRLHNEWGAGSLVVPAPDCIVATFMNDTPPQFTVNGGQAWDWCQIGTLPPPTKSTDVPGDPLPGSTKGWQRGYTIKSKRLIADKLRPGAVIAFNAGDGTGSATDLANRGWWENLTSGAGAWQHISDIQGPFAQSFWNCQVKQNLNRPGHFVHCGGNDQGGFNISLDYCRTWQAIPLFSQVETFTFGPALDASNYEWLYVFGVRASDGVRGFYVVKSFDPVSRTGNVAMIAQFPLNEPAWFGDLEADWGLPGRALASSGGVGQVIVDYVSKGTLNKA